MTAFKSQRIKAVLKDLLKKRGIKYEELAEQMECSVPTIKRILGPEELTLSRLLQLCEIVEIDLAELELLVGDSVEKVEKFTPEQEHFLAKNRSHLAYLFKLYDGKTPKQIAEANSLTQKSTDKYLIALERHGLIRVSGRLKVRPTFKYLPRFGRGELARGYFEGFITSAGRFFVEMIQLSLLNEPKDDSESRGFGVQVAKVTKDSYLEWVKEQEKARRAFLKRAEFEEKTLPESELRTVVSVNGYALVEHSDPHLKILENPVGEVINL